MVSPKIAGFSAVVAGIGTTFAALAPQDFVVISGVVTTIGLGLIALYQKFRDTRRAADLADVTALSDTWKARYERARQEASDWQQRAISAQTAGNEWQKLYKESRREPIQAPPPISSNKPLGLDSSSGSGGLPQPS